MTSTPTRLLLFTVLALTLGSISTSLTRAETCARLSTGGVSWWPGDGNATDVLDGNSGTLANGAGFAAAKVGQGFELNGVNQYVRVPSNAGLLPGSGSFSLEAWIRTSSRSGIHRIVTTYECGGEVCGSPSGFGSLYSLHVLGGFPVFALRDTTGTTSDLQTLSGPSFVGDGTFHHVAATRDMSSLTMNLYIDGHLDSAAALLPHSQGPIQQDDSETDPFTIGAAVMFGAEHPSGFLRRRDRRGCILPARSLPVRDMGCFQGRRRGALQEHPGRRWRRNCRFDRQLPGGPQPVQGRLGCRRRWRRL